MRSSLAGVMLMKIGLVLAVVSALAVAVVHASTDSHMYHGQPHPVLHGPPTARAEAPTTFLEGQTVVEWTRAIETCDAQDLPVETGATRVAWAYSGTKPEGDTPPTRHSKRGATSVRMFAPGTSPPPPADAEIIDMVLDNVTIPFPAEQPDTMYYCQTFQLPDDGHKRHIVRWEPIANPATNWDVLHHFLVYECPGLAPTSVGVHAPCFTGQLPRDASQCLGQSVIGAWAVGGHPFDLPENVGLPVGPGYSRYLLVEIHYNNPTFRVLHDSSGVRFTLTKTLRLHDAGILQTGVNTSPQFTIPPLTEATTYDGWCPAECTSKYLPEQGVQVVATLLHAHTSASSINLRHIRNQTELKPILTEPTYDFNFQDFEHHEPYITLMPGDRLKTTCTYNTLVPRREKVTNFGLSTHEEMCLSFLMYYPRLMGRNGLSTPNYCMYGNYTQWVGRPYEQAWCFNNTEAETEALVSKFSTTIEHPYQPPPCVRQAPPIDRTVPLAPTTLNLSKYERNEVLDFLDGRNYQLFWTANASSGYVHFAALVNTTGWIGLGFSPNGGMVNADMMMAWLSGVNGRGGVNITDRFAPSKSLPHIDTLQDYFDIRAVQFPVTAPSAPVIGELSVNATSVSVTVSVESHGGFAVSSVELWVYSSAPNVNVPERVVESIAFNQVMPFTATLTMTNLTTGANYSFAIGARSQVGIATQLTGYIVPTDPAVEPAQPAGVPVEYVLIGVGCAVVVGLLGYCFWRRRQDTTSGHPSLLTARHERYAEVKA